MRQLTTRQRFAFILSIYFFVLLLLLYIIFLVIFSITSSLQLKKELLAVSTDIINNHLVISNKSLVFKKDQEGSSLKEYLITHNSSSIFLSTTKSPIRTYGLFAINARDSEKKELYGLINELTDKKKYIERTIPWNGQKLKTVTVPLASDNKVVGFLIVAKSLEDISNAINIMTMLFVSLGVLTLTGSFIVGYLLVRWAFMPLRKMIGVIEKVEYDNLGTLLPISGNPSDEITHLSRKFNDMTSRLNDMAERQKAFIANASHELKTPLARAISSLDIVYEENSSNQKEIRLIREDLFEINNLIEQFLLLTKLKKDIHTIKPHNIHLNNFFESLKKRYEVELARKNLKLIISTPETAQLLISKDYFSIIFSNLLLNAIKYNFPDKNIFITAFDAGGELVITIRDEGVGMDEEELDRMFDRFYRGKGTSERGYGIGLSLVKQICDLYRIKIHAVSKKNNGTTISLHFPS